jgi:hypothetical protein
MSITDDSPKVAGWFLGAEITDGDFNSTTGSFQFISYLDTSGEQTEGIHEWAFSGMVIGDAIIGTFDRADLWPPNDPNDPPGIGPDKWKARRLQPGQPVTRPD